MIPLRKKNNVSPEDISLLIKSHFANLMQAFYESQSYFLCGVYKKYNNIETASINLYFSRNIHLEIIRQREKDLNFNVSLDNFWLNFNRINKPFEKIKSVVEITGIPKETVRRKVKNLLNLGDLSHNKKDKAYSWSLKPEEKDKYIEVVSQETKNLSLFVSKITNSLNLKLNSKIIEEEIRSQFSFYWYHYLSCQLAWLKYWNAKLKDNDLLLIALQATIPTLQFIDKKNNKINLDDVFKIIGQVKKNECKNCSVSASSVSEITGIPRATAIRKLDKLVNLGFLVQEEKNKRYSVNQSIDARTKNIMSKENVNFTIQTFSEYISIILNSLIHNKM
tara:strand:- start:566 stop:1570 length:1005 start_codon:yes stop_codon:yes gene_type:complete